MLPTKLHCNENVIINLDDLENSDIHWIAYERNNTGSPTKGNNTVYFDGFLDYQKNSNDISERDV